MAVESCPLFAWVTFFGGGTAGQAQTDSAASIHRPRQRETSVSYQATRNAGAHDTSAVTHNLMAATTPHTETGPHSSAAQVSQDAARTTCHVTPQLARAKGSASLSQHRSMLGAKATPGGNRVGPGHGV